MSQGSRSWEGGCIVQFTTRFIAEKFSNKTCKEFPLFSGKDFFRVFEGVLFFFFFFWGGGGGGEMYISKKKTSDFLKAL